MPWFNPEAVFRLIEKYQATKFIGVPTMYQILLNHPAADKYDTGSLERSSIRAAPVTEELYRAFTAKFSCSMYEGYGLNEASPAVAVERRSMPRKIGSTGIPMPGVEVKIFDHEDNELPTGEQGEIVIEPAPPKGISSPVAGSTNLHSTFKNGIPTVPNFPPKPFSVHI